MSHDERGHCFFVRQPSKEDETNAAIRAVWASCCGAVRYGGEDPQILTRFAEINLSAQCDHQLSRVVRPVVRNCVSFEYEQDPGEHRRVSLRRIVELLADSMSKPRYDDVRISMKGSNVGSLRVRWGNSVSAGGYSVNIVVICEATGRWLIRISENEVAHTTFAILVDQIIQQKSQIKSIQWFSEGELNGPRDRWWIHPY